MLPENMTMPHLSSPAVRASTIERDLPSGEIAMLWPVVRSRRLNTWVPAGNAIPPGISAWRLERP